MKVLERFRRRNEGLSVVFICGPYRGKTIWEVRENIRQAEEEALRWWKKGYVVICPHKNSALMDGGLGLSPEEEDRIWLEGSLELLRRSDIVVMTGKWNSSEGSLMELREARRLGKSIVYLSAGEEEEE